MASFISETQSNPDASSQEQSRGKKRRKLGDETSSGQNKNNDVVNASQGGRRSRRWRSETEKQNYSVKLLDALRQRSHRGVSSPRAAVEKGREVRETADRVLATAAKGTTRWSRAILASRVRLRARKVRRAKVTGDGRLRRRKEEEKKIPAVEKKVRVLSRLVPGCRSVSSFDSILEETRDYIAALEMQVKAMAALADILVANGSGGGGGDGAGAAVVESLR